MAEKEPEKTESKEKQIELVVGQPVQITLQSMAGSTGYSWFLSKLSGGLALSYTTSTSTASVPGQIAPTNQIFSFLATSKGSSEIEFSLIAPWRPGEAQDTEKYEVKITEPKKTAADDIAAAMKGRDFISASAVNVADPNMQIKYAAPMAQPAPMIEYAAPMAQAQAQPVLKYAAPMAQASACGLGTPAMVPPYAAPMSQVQPSYTPIDPCLDPRNSGLAARTMIAYAAPIGPSTVAVMDPCLGPRNTALAAKTMIAYAAPVGPATVAVMDPCLDPRNTALAARTMIAYAAPVGPSTVAAMDPCLDPRNTALAARTMILYAAPVAAMNQIQPVYAAPMSQAQPLYSAPMSQACPVQPMYAAPLSQAQPLYAAPMMPRYAAPCC